MVYVSLHAASISVLTMVIAFVKTLHQHHLFET